MFAKVQFTNMVKLKNMPERNMYLFKIIRLSIPDRLDQ